MDSVRRRQLPSARVVNWGNLFVCLFAFMMALTMTLFSLRPDSDVGLQHSHVNPVIEDGYCALMSAPERVALPGPAKAFIVPCTGQYGVLDAMNYLTQFFATPLSASYQCSHEDIEEEQPTRTLSDVYRQVLLLRRFLPTLSTGSGDGTARDTRASSLNLLHLCSANACVGPLLSRAFAQGTKTSAQTRMAVFALVYGASGNEGGSLLEELHRNGVWTVPQQGQVGVVSTREENEEERKSLLPPLPLYGLLNPPTQNSSSGISAAVLEGGALKGVCGRNDGVCRYRYFARGSDVIDGATWPEVPVQRFHDVVFNDQYILHEFPLDLVSIDVGPEHAVAMRMYLIGLAHTVHDENLLPLTIVLSLYAGEWLSDTVAAVGRLLGKKPGRYYAHLLTPECKRYVSLVPSATGNDDEDEQVLSLKTMGNTSRNSQYKARASSAYPLCVLLLSRHHHTPQSVNELLCSAAVSSNGTQEFLVGADATLDTRSLSHIAAARFFHSPSSTCTVSDIFSGTKIGERETDVASHIGGWFFAGWEMMQPWLVIMIPAAVCLVLLWNISKSCRGAPSFSVHRRR